MLEKLTQEQTAALEETKDKWIKIGLSTEPVNKEKTKNAIKLVYGCANLKPPQIFIFLRSPFEGVIGSYILWNQVENQVWNQIYACGYGSQDASWLAFYDYFLKHTNVKNIEKMAGLIEISKTCGWWWSFENAVIVTERPNKILRDERFMLHSSSSPALSYSDGFSIYAYHGVRVPKEIIMEPHNITIPQIESERNLEVRRIMIEQYGPADYLKNSGAEKVHEDKFGQLYRKEIQNDEPLVMIRVVDASKHGDLPPREYFIRVPPNMTKAKDAVAWSFGVEEKDYAPDIES